jgi:hypothetical protein
METVDLSNYSFDDFVGFLFKHPVVPVPRPGDGEPEPWYWQIEVQFDPTAVAGFYIRLFTEPATALAGYPADALEQGFWAIMSGNLDCGVTAAIWHEGVPLEIRESVIRSMYTLYKDFFASHHLETADDMWWDSLAYDWHCNLRARSNGGEDHSMQDLMFEVLTKILELPSTHTRFAALHGLGHLRHPDTPHHVQAWLARTAPLEVELIEYAQLAAKFEVM